MLYIFFRHEILNNMKNSEPTANVLNSISVPQEEYEKQKNQKKTTAVKTKRSEDNGNKLTEKKIFIES